MKDKEILEGEYTVKSETDSEKIEISPGLERMAQTAAEQESSKKQEQEKQSESEQEKKEKFAREIASGVLSGLDELLDMWLQVNTGLTKDERAQFSKDFAPLLVRMGVTDYRGFLDGYGCYVMAAVGLFRVSVKTMRNVQTQLIEQAEKAQAVAPAAASQQEMQQEAGAYQQDFTGKGL